jgi:feruloyl esterase
MGFMGESATQRFYSSWTWPYPEGFYRDYVHADAKWTVRDFNLHQDLAEAQKGVIGIGGYAQNPDLSVFKRAGGKLLMWHGWHDMSIPAANSIPYFN